MPSTLFQALGALACAVTFASPALAAGGEGADERGLPTSTLDLSYNLYVGGITLGKVGMSAQLQGADYKATSTLETKGVVNAFWQAKIETSSNGTIGEDRVQPSLYDSFSVRRTGQRQEVTLTFNSDGPKSVYSNPPYEQDKYPVSETLKKRALDPLSAVLYLTTSFQANQNKPCGVVAPVFDGRRRYNVALSFVKRTDVHMDNGLYQGPALVCQIHYDEVAGYKQKILEEGQKLPNIYAWVAAFQSTSDPGRHYLVPLRIWAETAYGIAVAVASEVKLDGSDVHGAS